MVTVQSPDVCCVVDLNFSFCARKSDFVWTTLISSGVSCFVSFCFMMCYCFSVLQSAFLYHMNVFWFMYANSCSCYTESPNNRKGLYLYLSIYQVYIVWSVHLKANPFLVPWYSIPIPGLSWCTHMPWKKISIKMEGNKFGAYSEPVWPSGRALGS